MAAPGSEDDLQTFVGGTTVGGQVEATTLAPHASASPATPGLPATIGRYRILRLIGEGGMGAVYEAEQDQPRRTVALKVIKPGYANAELLRRFAQEAQALGRLQHQGIAQIFDAGTADTGFGPQPYFAMELIRGESLRDYADSHRLTTRQRLELMARVCDAVQHAHQRGLIHRDLKPGNILVDETGQPKILDFGVARITDSDSQATMQTDVGQLVGTLAYMSPEQVLADPLDIDTRSDVYALGVILYELLAGRLPYDISKRLPEVVATIREQDPSRLSSIDRSFRGDVETIVAKALEKEKTRRYASAAELGADITRHLKDEPIVAQPPTVTYQVRKFARRHKALVGGIAAVFVVLVGGVVVSTWQAVRASRAEAAAVLERDRASAAERAATAARDEAIASQRQAVEAEGQARQAENQARQERDRAVAEKERADIESATAKAVSEFMQRNLFEQVTGGGTAGGGQSNAGGPSVSVALDRAATNVEASFKGQPLVEAGVREAIGRAYLGLSLFDQAIAQLERAVAVRRRVQPADAPDVLNAEVSIGSADFGRRRFAQAAARLERVVAASARIRGGDHVDTLRFRLQLALYYLNDIKPDQAASHARTAAEGRQRTLGAAHRDTLTARSVEAIAYEQGKQFDRAIETATLTYNTARRAHGNQDEATRSALTLVQRVTLAKPQSSPRDGAARAEFLAGTAKLLDGAKATSLPEMISLATSRADTAIRRGRPQDAEAVLVETIDAASRAGQEELLLLGLLTGAYGMQKKYTEGEATLARVLAKPEGVKALPPTILPFALRSLATSYRNDGRFADAERHFRALVPLVLENPGEAAGQTRTDVLLLADTYSSLGRYADAEQWFTRLLEMNRRTKAPEQLTVVVLAAIGWTRLKQGRYADAEAPLRDLSEAVVRTSPDVWERFTLGSMLGASLAGQRHFAEAEPLLVAGYEGMATRKPSANPNFRSRFTLPEAGEAILQLYTDWGNTAKRAEWAARLEK